MLGDNLYEADCSLIPGGLVLAARTILISIPDFHADLVTAIEFVQNTER